jgi:hypothetical protein
LEVPPPPQVRFPEHVPQSRFTPQPLETVPQFFPSAEQVVATQPEPHTFAVPPPPQVEEPEQEPQSMFCPQPFGIVPQFLP